MTSVTERLGHSTTAYPQDASQEVMPRMQRKAARRFNQQLRNADISDEKQGGGGTQE